MFRPAGVCEKGWMETGEESCGVGGKDRKSYSDGGDRRANRGFRSFA